MGVRKVVASLLAAVFLFGLSSSFVFAQSISDFQGASGCNLDDPRSCNCVFLFRNTNGEIFGSLKGSTSRDIALEEAFPFMEDKRNVEWSVIAWEDTEDKRENECRANQVRTTNSFSIEELLALGAGGCIAGSFIPVPGVGCGVGALAVTVIEGELIDGIGRLLTGQWTREDVEGGQSGWSSCNWTSRPGMSGKYSVKSWKGIDFGFGTDRVSALLYEGNNDTLVGERLYCAVGIIRNDFEAMGRELQFQDFAVCDQAPGDAGDISTPRGKCEACLTKSGIWTAVGCLPTNLTGLVSSLVTIGLSISGGVAMLMILVGAYMLSISRGDPKRTNEAREIITSAIIGILFVIFSITILQFIGVQIFRIPGFGG